MKFKNLFQVWYLDLLKYEMTLKYTDLHIVKKVL